MMGRMRQYRVYALSDDIPVLRQNYVSQVSTRDCAMLLEGRYNHSGEKRRGWSVYTLFQGLWSEISPARDLSRASAILASRNDVQSIALSRRKSERLEYFFCPPTEDVLRTIVENAARFLELIDQRRA